MLVIRGCRSLASCGSKDDGRVRGRHVTGIQLRLSLCARDSPNDSPEDASSSGSCGAGSANSSLGHDNPPAPTGDQATYTT